MTTTTTPRAQTSTGGPADVIGADLMRTLRALKLGQMADTLPERLTLARTRGISHANFLELVLGDEVERRESTSAMRRARAAGLDPNMRLDTWTEPSDLRYDRALLSDLATLRFLDNGNGILVLGAVGVGKTHLASALGHIAVRRRISVHFARADKLFTRLRAARLDNTLEAEIRRLTHVDLLLIDDFALRPLGQAETSDFYELIVERHKKASTIINSNRSPDEWLGMTTDALLAQSAIDRYTSTAHTLVIEGPSYRQRNRPGRPTNVDTRNEAKQ
jgi:DNA replication protein DnaC